MFDQLAARQEIEQRNRLRAEAKLPPVSVEAEIQRAERVAARKDYESQLRKFLKDRGKNEGGGFFGAWAFKVMKEMEFKSQTWQED